MGHIAAPPPISRGRADKMASCCNEWEHVFDVKGGAVAVNEGVVRHDYDVVTGFWQSTDAAR